MSLVSPNAVLPWLIFLPLLLAIACALVSAPRVRFVVSLAGATALTVMAAYLLTSLPEMEEGARRYVFGGWRAPLGIELYIDGLAALMVMISAVVCFALTIYSDGYFSSGAKATRFWPLWWSLIAGLNAIFLAADAFNIYVAIEILSLAAVALVAVQGSLAALRAALRYLMVSLLGSLFYLLGIALLYRAYGTLDLALLAAAVKSEPVSWAALASISTGLMLKTALLPLHFWLPPAHGGAPAPVSAVLSALVVKASFYLLIRFWLETLAPASSLEGLKLLGLLGAGAVIWGSIQAIRARRLKMIVAYSTVAQLGYLFLLFPLAAESHHVAGAGIAALDAVAFFIVAHALAKSAMFLAAGGILHAAGHDNIDQLKGLAQKMPLSMTVFAIAGASLIGLPPSGGFIAKWLLLNVAIDTGQWWWIVVIITGGLLAAVYVFRVLNLAFSNEDQKGDSELHVTPLPYSMTLSALLLAILAMLLGFNALWVANLLEVGPNTFDIRLLSEVVP